MNDRPTDNPAPPPLPDAQAGGANLDDLIETVSPDEMVRNFRGKPIIEILAITLVAHVLFIGVFSAGYLMEQVLGEDTSSLSDAERLDIAVREGTTALREIAERHNVRVQDLSGRFAGAAKPIAPTDDGDGGTTGTKPDDGATPGGTDEPAAPQPPASDIEQTLQQAEPGPDVPDLSAEHEDDLFAPEEPE